MASHEILGRKVNVYWRRADLALLERWRPVPSAPRHAISILRHRQCRRPWRGLRRRSARLFLRTTKALSLTQDG